MGQWITNPPLAVPPPTQQPSGKLFSANNQDIPDGGAPVLVNLNTIQSDFTDGIEDTVNHIITPGVLGWYLVTASVCWESATIDTRYDLSLTLNPGGNHRLFNSQVCSYTAGSGGHFFMKVTDIIKITNIIQYFKLNVVNNHISDHATLINGHDFTFMTVQRVR